MLILLSLQAPPLLRPQSPPILILLPTLLFHMPLMACMPTMDTPMPMATTHTLTVGSTLTPMDIIPMLSPSLLRLRLRLLKLRENKKTKLFHHMFKKNEPKMCCSYENYVRYANHHLLPYF